ncbi:hypothetical protein GXW84_42250 [Rhodococcus sp. IEGM 248]|uniref:hypothetical protein n=1 Tax=Rhodococcus opacus TaxID=37919 RepID=UPI0013C2393D|nr:hypothetical protein [Rhodococcus opacus]MDV7088307.1 hypothetical protein [Rhodococcus opacus]NDV10920.1 hypothetical protein [Rhodococcus sp. IEGM 248]
MNLVSGTARVATGAGEAATATLGAVGGAAVGGLVGSMKGAAVGAAEGARRGSRSTPAAVLTMGAVAVTGVVQWPIVAAVGGTALVLDQLKLGTRPDKQGTGEPSTGPGTAAEAKTPTPAQNVAAVPAAPAGAAAEAKTPAPAAKAVRGRRTPARTSSAKTPPSLTP